MLSESVNKFFNRNTNAEWFLLKLSVAFIWVSIAGRLFIDNATIPYPSGLCSLFNCQFMIWLNTAHFFYKVAVVLCIPYLLERWMKYTTLLMFVMSCLMFTLEESNGVLNRCSLYSLIFLAQSIAYFIGGPGLKKNRLQFAVQIIAAGYFLAGTSKLIASGPGWVTDAPNAAIQIVKNYAYEYFNSGDPKVMDMGMRQADFVLKNNAFIILLFGMSLILELTAWVAMASKRIAFLYGCMLFGMHMGIYYYMDILIVAIYYPMLIILINPLYTTWFWLSQALGWIKKKLDF